MDTVGEALGAKEGTTVGEMEITGALLGARVGTTVGAADGAMDGSTELGATLGLAEGARVGTADGASVKLGSYAWTVFDSKVTAPVMARNGPVEVALVPTEMDWSAMITPCIAADSPMVAEVPTLQNTLTAVEAELTLEITTEAVPATSSVVGHINIQHASGSSLAFRVKIPPI
jgi:hypothetical protein